MTEHTPPPADVLDTVEAAELIGFRPATLRQWRHENKAGQPEFIRLENGAIRYRRDTLEAWATLKNTTAPTAAD